MLRKLGWFILLGLGFLVSACSTGQAVLKEHSEYKACKASCIQKFNQCRKECQDNCPNCAKKAFCQAKRGYSRYVHEECVKGGFIARQLNSYRDPLKCRKVSCNCSADLSICVQACGGEIKKYWRAPPTCC